MCQIKAIVLQNISMQIIIKIIIIFPCGVEKYEEKSTERKNG